LGDADLYKAAQGDEQAWCTSALKAKLAISPATS
jgi:hypothetical protein